MSIQKLSRCRRTGYAAADLPRDLLIRLVECPDLPLRMGPAETIKAGNSALVVRAVLPVGGEMVSVAYKRVRRKTLLKRLTQALGANRTLRTFLAGHRLLAAGVATARPLAAVIPNRFDLASPSWLATEWLTGSSDLATFAELCRTLPSSEQECRKMSAADAVGALLGKLHAARIAHRDLKPQNLMVRFDAAGRAEAFLVDLDGVSFPRRLSERVRWRNLSRLAVARDDVFGPDAAPRFLKAYSEAAGISLGLEAARRRLDAATAFRRDRRAA